MSTGANEHTLLWEETYEGECRWHGGWTRSQLLALGGLVGKLGSASLVETRLVVSSSSRHLFAALKPLQGLAPGPGLLGAAPGVVGEAFCTSGVRHVEKSFRCLCTLVSHKSMRRPASFVMWALDGDRTSWLGVEISEGGGLHLGLCLRRVKRRQQGRFCVDMLHVYLLVWWLGVDSLGWSSRHMETIHTHALGGLKEHTRVYEHWGLIPGNLVLWHLPLCPLECMMCPQWVSDQPCFPLSPVPSMISALVTSPLVTSPLCHKDSSAPCLSGSTLLQFTSLIDGRRL